MRSRHPGNGQNCCWITKHYDAEKSTKLLKQRAPVVRHAQKFHECHLRLVTKGTIDEKIVLRAAAKRKIEKLVIHK